ncbi:hypothetical protein BZA05DRAFT_393108 [Tricharina praecox]|uniref:uncharacterized protein n=1 Tax=Tricharina praecox TaxID=43433 RepID=UPI00221FCE5F|nr:uncharacterized protein BZA05DRAFT_393108 [Tricharina praecox]KAI5854969.1 hypothetical protein BZA05DRAFT_393108 [Tricharina praecox]
MLFTTLSSLLLLAVSAAASPTPAPQFNHLLHSSTTGGLDFVPGITIPPVCITTPISIESGITCPGKLASGNTLVTARHIVVNGLTGASKKMSNVLSAGWFFESKENRTYEESTLSIFDFPGGHDGAQCRFQFITDGQSDGGDLVEAAVRIYNVWALQEHSGVVGEDSTYNNKPARTEVVAAFTTTFKDESYITENGKHVHSFVYGPGEKSLSSQPAATFPCPKGGKVAYEVASAMKTSGKNDGNNININGHSGLGIEIIGVKSAWP